MVWWHVTMQDDLLYKKGSNKVAKDGETALGTLASVLNEDPNLKGCGDRSHGRQGSEGWRQLDREHRKGKQCCTHAQDDVRSIHPGLHLPDRDSIMQRAITQQKKAGHRTGGQKFFFLSGAFQTAEQRIITDIYQYKEG